MSSWQQIRMDRRFWTLAWVVFALYFVVLGAGESGWRIIPAAVAVSGAALAAGVHGMKRRREGRWNTPTDNGPVELDEALTAEVRALVQAGRQIEAVTLVRARTGAGLVAAKQTVDDVSRPTSERTSIETQERVER